MIFSRLSTIILLCLSIVTNVAVVAEELSGADVIAAVTSEEWDNAEANKIVVTINDSEDNFNFSPADLTFVAGTAYVLRIENNASNTGEHYYSSPELYMTSAMRKIQSQMAEVKADFLGDVELLPPSGGATWVEYYFVPMVPGNYNVICTIGDHAARGMNGTITVTDENNIQDTLVTDLASDFTIDTPADPDERRSGDHPIWESAVTVEVEILSPNADMTGYAFEPTDLELEVGQAYVLKIKQIGDGTNDKHYYTATEFYRTVVMRKIEDGSAEMKFPYINAVELTDTPELAGEETFVDLYIIPTKEGVYDVLCTIEGHAEAGMEGTITVVSGDRDPAGDTGPSTDGASSHISYSLSFFLLIPLWFSM